VRSAAFVVAALTTLIAVAPVAPAAQEPFKAGAKTVAVYTTVTAMDGRLVTDLDRDAFDVDDNGKRQDITVFANDLQPITVVILLDRSGSLRANFSLEEQAAETFVTAMSPADKARIGSFSNRIQLDPRDFTSDHGELLDILHTELQDEGPTPLWNAVNVGITALLHQQGRRVVLVFTDGADNPANGSSNNNTLKDVMKRAEEEDIMVYAIGLAGQNSPGGGRGGGGGFGGGRGGRGGFGGPRGGFGGGGAPSAGKGGNAAFDKPDEGLPKIASATGGGYFELMSARDLVSSFARIADELHHQYVLGFTPQMLDGKIHKLDVRVKTVGLIPRARRTYLARP
jgi:Ca-activated chloride channel family protein